MRAGRQERERRLVLACLLRQGEALAPLARDVDWDAALELAGSYAVLEQVAHALLGAGGDTLSEAVRHRLSQASASAAARNALLLHDLARAQALLRARGVRSAALKGAALLAAHAPSVAARHLSDVDLLVAPAELELAAAALAEGGLAAPAGALPALDGGTGPLARNPGTPHLRAMETWGSMLLELHDRLPGGGPRAEEVVAAARTVRFAGEPLDVAAPDDLAGMLCRHALVAHRDDARVRARHVADLGWLEDAADWSRAAERYGRGVVRASLALQAAGRREAAGRGRAPRRLGLLDPTPNRRVTRIGAVVGLALRGPIRAAFPSRRYMEQRFGLSPGTAWLPLLYPWRLVRGAARLLSGR